MDKDMVAVLSGLTDDEADYVYRLSPPQFWTWYAEYSQRVSAGENVG